MLEIFLEFPAGSFLFTERASLSRSCTFETPREREKAPAQRACTGSGLDEKPFHPRSRNSRKENEEKKRKKKKYKPAKYSEINVPLLPCFALFCPLLGRVAADRGDEKRINNASPVLSGAQRPRDLPKWNVHGETRFITLLFAINLLVNSIVARRDNRDNVPFRARSPPLFPSIIRLLHANAFFEHARISAFRIF